MLKLRSRFLNDIFRVGFTQVIVALISMLLLRVMADWLGPAELGAYMVIRRALAIIVPVALLNLDLGVVRYVALCPEKARDYLGWGVLLGGLANLSFLMVAWLGGSRLANLIFGEPDLALLLVPTVVLSAGIVTYSYLYAYFRGQQHIVQANLLQVAHYTVLLATALILKQSVSGTMSALVLYLCLGGGVTLILFGVLILREKFRLSLERQLLGELIRYGLPRLPSGFFLAGTLSIPVFAASQRVSLEAAASLGIGLSILPFFELAAMSIGVVLLPKMADLIRQGEEPKIRQAGTHVIMAANYGAVLIALTAPGLSAEIVKIWFGDKYLTAIPIARVGLMAAGPYLAYMFLRGLLDAVTVQPVVTYLTLASVLCTGGISLLARSEIQLATALLVGLFCLGLGAVTISVHLLKVRFGPTDRLGLGLTLLVGLFILGSDLWLASWALWPALVLKLSIRTVLVGGLALVLWQLQVPWFLETMRCLPVLDRLIHTNCDERLSSSK